MVRKQNEKSRDLKYFQPAEGRPVTPKKPSIGSQKGLEGGTTPKIGFWLIISKIEPTCKKKIQVSKGVLPLWESHIFDNTIYLCSYYEIQKIFLNLLTFVQAKQIERPLWYDSSWWKKRETCEWGDIVWRHNSRDPWAVLLPRLYSLWGI